MVKVQPNLSRYLSRWVVICWVSLTRAGSPEIYRCSSCRINDQYISTGENRIIRRRCQLGPYPSSSVPLSAPIDPYHVNVMFIPADSSTPSPVLVRVKGILSEEDFEIKVLALGGESAQYWTRDFGYTAVFVGCVSYRWISNRCWGCVWDLQMSI
ncbi:uncharacterized protein EDB91DRAFT_509476 [Suillus paluster]|uniref:uncharacterized protein n=1 Tax=Suillus paluster TaxID=48578 RepID=UPI001B8793C0|nr:uncharacterized protein EDB91DRAFT_509476 [Suillus paluster]KAG1752296.1 hypothetical protein EDB91DRAFT_509476 [Suillus paluster]